MATAVGDSFPEMHCEDRGSRGFVDLGDEAGVSSQSADNGWMELAMEVATAERACSQAKRRYLYLQGLICEASEVLDRGPQCS